MRVCAGATGAERQTQKMINSHMLGCSHTVIFEEGVSVWSLFFFPQVFGFERKQFDPVHR